MSYDNKQKMTRIIHARTQDHYQWVRKLFQQYAGFLGLELEFQGFSQELANLPGDYSAPQGCILMAVRTEEFVGCVALRPLEDSICEMKRLFRYNPLDNPTYFELDLGE